jgi:hypothetical protein
MDEEIKCAKSLIDDLAFVCGKLVSIITRMQNANFIGPIDAVNLIVSSKDLIDSIDFSIQKAVYKHSEDERSPDNPFTVGDQ